MLVYLLKDRHKFVIGHAQRNLRCRMADRTKIWIADKMKKLMAGTPIDKIRVTEICDLADISKPTFYYHFKDKYDLVAWIFFYSHFNVDVLSVESASESMNQVRNDFIFYKRAFEDSSQNALWQYMVDYFTERYEAEARQILDVEVLDTQTHFSISLYCHGAVGMVREWLLSDNITPAETIVRMMFASMPEPLKSSTTN